MPTSRRPQAKPVAYSMDQYRALELYADGLETKIKALTAELKTLRSHTAPDSEASVAADGYISKDRVCELTNLSAMTIWRKVKAGTFPKSRKLSENRVAWLETEVRAWMVNPLGWALSVEDSE